MQKIVKTFLLSIITVSTAIAQHDPLKYASTITAEDLKKHLTVIAGAEMEGRETATAGQRKAAIYIENYFKSLGLKPGNKNSYQQLFPLMEDSVKSSSIQIGKNILEPGRDYMITTLNSTKNINAKKIVFAGYGIDDSLYSDYTDLDVKGAIVVVAAGEPRKNGFFFLGGRNRFSAWSNISTKIQAAGEKGAAALWLISPGTGIIDREVSNNQLKSGAYFPRIGNDVTNSATISQNVFTTIFGEAFAVPIIKRLSAADMFAMADYKSVKMQTLFNYEEDTYEKATSSNVIAVEEGTDKKDEYVFLTAHYDHIGRRGDIIHYGADDDGSGTVSVLEMAEAFSKAKAEGHAPRRTIVFMTVSGEEKGLWGSEYYADHPIFPLEKTTVDLNTDMVGRIDPKRKSGDSLNYVYIIGDNKLSSELKPISESINRKYSNLELDYKYNDPKDPERIYYRSDHYNFAKKGVPIIFYFNGTHADYHRPTDTVDKINFDLMEKRVRFIFYTAWEMANRDEMLKRDLPIP
jgi:hypothetical protein